MDYSGEYDVYQEFLDYYTEKSIKKILIRKYFQTANQCQLSKDAPG